MPFCEPAMTGIEVGPLKIDNATTTFIETLARLLDLLGGPVDRLDRSAVVLALAIAEAAGTLVYYFAADDELTDMACKTAPGELVVFGSCLDAVSIQYSDGRTNVTPLRFLDEEEEENSLQDVIDSLEHFPGISLAQTVDVDDGRPLYENPLKHWPPEAGNATKHLGLGSWDPFADLATWFDIVRES